ncbi:MAG: Asp-tRNA(Asn)/Glu-tRNA(Gln) amidotransferase subunit GatB [Candidatus Omnitrophica bacterium]|nr:Asp-tRNA(Asn)/Glu-tRNA(Gln) amidotransferase subunit GatB [Candidatus Omnitrophota bacterium]MBU1047744.1 Asp-tRNA(Asn)/Glu-tRNA(Gln) amidotransferase subunit GatB [Candidatus Omnitrophota bacterium]MBU1630899.1 Asp-tRNA(Asn)/Glu-tRNA(Gln) amidotransferase subunit GatB [Candidatus Omnitrophota bacterium]MBU1767616.1 Asp-tRNA(Asn)/Glu-tRNA(Gln) amidotransferase subunit GatB [Candidatus Omnitrophota bacterium]MBU1889366.1 Asp-tRNA(Asn)/Glu-tRNA(Gln) amidotransferase subunit GatB [Candidatus Om
MTYEPVIGLEIHAELATETKLFCGCSTKFGSPPNSQVCPVCMGLPGVLPVVNEKAVEYMIRTALALNCIITHLTKFDRKNYYYPDLPKNYQISQQYLPFAKDGFLEIKLGDKIKRIGVDNIHLEEDAGKNIHLENGQASLVDLNRTGIPLIEIVTKPDMRSLEEVEVFMNNLRDILLYIGISDCKMEEGSLRFEANISVREKGEDILSPRVEIKNLNSFKIVLAAIKYEVERQKETLEKGEKVSQETRLWDEEGQKTHPMRSKEEAHDYRYFPEPDLPPLFISDEEIERIKKELPELPNARKERFAVEYGLTEYDSNILISNKETADFFEECLKEFNQSRSDNIGAKEIANWLIGPVAGYLNEHNITITESKLTSEHLISLLTLVKEGKINQNTAKNILTKIFEKGKHPQEIVKENGLAQVTDEEELSQAVDKVLKENQQVIDDFKKGKTNAFGFLVGQVMKSTKGKANPKIVNELLNQKLKK